METFVLFSNVFALTLPILILQIKDSLMVYYTFIFTLVEDFTKMVTKATMSYPSPPRSRRPTSGPQTHKHPKSWVPHFHNPYIGE